MQLYGGDTVCLYNTATQEYILSKTMDRYERSNVQRIIPFPTFSPNHASAQYFEILVVHNPPLTHVAHSPQQRYRGTTDSRELLTPGTAFRLRRVNENDREPQFLTVIQRLGSDFFESAFRYNFTVLHRSVLAYTTADDNEMGTLLTASGSDAFTSLTVATFYSRAVIQFPEYPGAENFELMPSWRQPIDQSKRTQWSFVPKQVVVLRGCEVQDTVDMTISPEATDSNGSRVFRTAEECNAYRHAYPKDYIMGWQCVNAGGEYGVNRCVSVTQYTMNEKQPLHQSVGTCLQYCRNPQLEKTAAMASAPMQAKEEEKDKEKSDWSETVIVAIVVVVVVIAVVVIYSYGKHKSQAETK